MEITEKVTARHIMDTITGWVEQKRQLTAEEWVSAAEKLNMLESFEHDKLVELEHEVANLMQMALESQEKKNVSQAKMKVQADPKYSELRKQELFIKRIDEAIRLAKHHARLVSYTS